jgi:hypothetical protein
MKITKRQLKRIIREEKQKLIESYGLEGETDSLYAQSLDDGTVQITQLNDNQIIEFPINELKELIDVLYEIYEADRQMKSSR